MAKTVALIDDDQDDLEILKETLHSIDPTLLCISFIYPLEAIRVITSELLIVPDYIFTDINMPGVTGDQCLREFRKHSALKKTVISVLSTSMPPDVAEALKRIGADYVLQKPNSVETFKSMLIPIFSQNQISLSSER